MFCWLLQLLLTKSGFVDFLILVQLYVAINNFRHNNTYLVVLIKRELTVQPRSSWGITSVEQYNRFIEHCLFLLSFISFSFLLWALKQIGFIVCTWLIFISLFLYKVPLKRTRYISVLTSLHCLFYLIRDYTFTHLN